MPAATYEELYTVNDYKRWEGDWELIYGNAYAMAPSPIVTHQLLAANIIFELKSNIDKCPACLVLGETDWEISNDTILKPDVLLICKEISEKINKNPEIIFEIISPSSAKRDEILKYDIYEKEGVNYYIIVYPGNRIAKIYKLNSNGKYIKEGDFDNSEYTFELPKCSLNFNFSKIWR